MQSGVASSIEPCNTSSARHDASTTWGTNVEDPGLHSRKLDLNGALQKTSVATKAPPCLVIVKYVMSWALDDNDSKNKLTDMLKT